MSTQQRRHTRNNIIYLLITAVMICAVFFTMVNYFYTRAEDEAYEMLHVQTKQIKDDLILQIKSDRENLVTMAHFLAKLYSDGEDYDIMFESFEPIGLLSNIGVLNPDNVFVTKVGSMDLSGKISFEEEAKRGEYISGRIKDLTREDEEIIRTAVPIVSEGETVGILYGVIHLETINKRYGEMADSLDAQLFVYDNESGNFVINSLKNDMSNVSELKNRVYNDGYSYEEMISSENGFVSFESIYKDEDMLLHYSPIEEFDWKIMLARYDSQVFSNTYTITNFVSLLLMLVIVIIVAYTTVVLKNERTTSAVTQSASAIRKLLLDINQQEENITKALKRITKTANAHSAVYANIENEVHYYLQEGLESNILSSDEEKLFVSELLNYAVEFKEAGFESVRVINMRANERLLQSKPHFYELFKKHGIDVISLATIAHGSSKRLSVLCIVNPKNAFSSRTLLQEIAVCFSIAIYNKNHLNKTRVAATTDSLTGVLNRTAYRKDVIEFDKQKPEKFSCIYIDVNGLHIRNNRFGHSAGDKMLIDIAQILREAFPEQKIYRMGGDEFLVFVKNTDQETVEKKIEMIKLQLRDYDYHVAIGMSYKENNLNTEETVKESEAKMFEAKAKFYQNKEHQDKPKEIGTTYIQTKTGIKEIDTIVSVMKDHYYGIYGVNLDTDAARGVLMPSYLLSNEDENNFSDILSNYVDELVHPDYHRGVLSILNYDAIKAQLSDGFIPKVSYKKITGESVVLSVYKSDEISENVSDTLWVFEKA